MSLKLDSPNLSFGFRPDFPFVRIVGLVWTLILIYLTRPLIDQHVPTPYYAIQNSEGTNLIIFTELSIWILILITYVILLTVVFIIPLTLYFRGLQEWEWDPTHVVFWLMITKGISIFLSEISKTNDNLEYYTLVLVDIVNSIFVIFATVFAMRTYSNYVVPVISDWLNVGKSDTQYGPLLDIIGSLLIITFGLTNFLSSYHVDFGVLIAGVGVVGLVVALAAQDTLSNFFSGILLLLDQGFKTGDMIYFKDTYCIIRDIGLRSTKIYDIINHVIIIIPNNSLANQEIMNLTRPDRYYRLRTEVGVSYDSNPDEVEALLLEVANENDQIEHDDPTRKPLVRFREFGDSALNFILVAWIKNVIKIRQINSDLHHQIFEKLSKAGVVIAFPQRDVHIHDVPTNYKVKKPETSTSKESREEAEEKARQAEKELKQAEESARQAEEERATLEVEEAKRQLEKAAKIAEEAARKAEEEKSKKAEREAKKAEEAAKKAKEEKAKLEAEEALRKAEEDKARKEADKEAEREAKKEAEREAKKAEEEKARFEAEEAIRLADEKKARIEAEKAAKIAEEKKAKLEVEEAETRKLIEEIKARQEAAEKK